jgi:hypothetical protein
MASLGWVLGGGWSAMAMVRSHFAVLDPDLDGDLAVVPWTTMGVGIEVDR